MSKIIAGIDLGTSTSEIAIYQDGEAKVISDPDSPSRSPIVPSIIAIDRKGRLLVGETARSYVDLPGHGLREVKRLMGSSQKVTFGEKTYRPQEMSALILKHLKKNAELATGSQVKRVVVSVPANFDDAAKQATKDAAELAELEVIRLINEPTAASLAFGIKNLDLEGQVVVFDFGGGTLDITVLEMMGGVLDVKASYGDTQLGGKDFDAILLDYLKESFNKEYPNSLVSERSLASLRTEAEKAKICLSRNDSAMVRCSNYATLKGEPLDLEIEITREKFESIIAPLLDRSRECIKRTLEAKKIRPPSINEILLVGGTTYIPAVRNLVAEMFGKKPVSKVDPDLAVVQGAAVQAALAEGAISPEDGLILTDVCPFGLGVHIVGIVGKHVVTNLYDPLIPRNTTVPFTMKKRYSLLSEDQDQAEICIYQDREGTATTIDEAIPTGLVAVLEDIPESDTEEPHSVDIEFSYDINGIVKLRAVIESTGQEVEIVSYNDSERRMSDEDIKKSRETIDDLWKKSPLNKRFEPVVKRAEQQLPSMSTANKSKVEKLLDRLKNAMVKENEVEADKASDALVDLLFEIQG